MPGVHKRVNQTPKTIAPQCGVLGGAGYPCRLIDGDEQMGMILGFALFVGVLIGAVVSIVLCILAIVMTKKATNERLNVWPLFVVWFIVCQSALLIAISYFPFASARPGSDYDVVMTNVFLQGIFYASSPGVAAILALLSTCLGCRKPERTTRHETHSA